MTLLFKLFELAVILVGGFLEILFLHGELGLELMDFSPVELFETG